VTAGAQGQHGGGKAGPGRGPALPSLAAQEQAITAALRAQPGTLHYVADASGQVSVLGLSDQLSVVGFGHVVQRAGLGTQRVLDRPLLRGQAGQGRTRPRTRLHVAVVAGRAGEAHLYRLGGQ